ncbi:glutamate 5-kinase [Qipengyuania sp. DGS5-3]|uniref:glutamate 5-kinase n=1 Tax=Qipengyuania sp. DGS5-3 TaxID=3349632 RepID=UPI0036D41417
MAVSALSQIGDAKRIVIKIGSALLVEGGVPRDVWLQSIARDISERRADGQDVIVVCSGAIALGAARLNLAKGGRGSLADAQAAAAVGQIELANLWSAALSGRGLTAAQLLLTLDDLEDRRRYLNGSATLERLLDAGTVPVINENDSVATEEIRFGDNDRLAARVAQAVGADLVLLLSDVDGLYDRDPAAPDAKLIRQVDGITPEITAMASTASSSGLGSGGMASKLQAAEIAERAGITLAIINGKPDAPIARAIEQNRGTVFLPQRRDGARKVWLGGRLNAAGTLHVDEGCVRAMASDGASLLAVGITSVDGSFQRGDLVSICGPDGVPLGQGLSEYDAVSCRRIAGLREDHQAKVLGHAPRAAVVHRDHMVLS